MSEVLTYMERHIEGSMPFDHAFENADSNEELCHATGLEVSFDGGNFWWTEYVDSLGDLHYGN